MVTGLAPALPTGGAREEDPMGVGLSTTCPICSGLAEPAFMSGEYRMFRCRSCRTAFVWPQPTPAQLAAFYSRYHLDAASGGYYEEVESRMQADFSAKVRLLKQALGGRAGRVLDVGCG